MRKLQMGLFLLAMATLHVPASGSDFTTMYSTQTLEEAANIYSESLRAIWTEDLIARLPDSQRQAARAVSLNIPIYGHRAQPLEYYAKAREHEVTIPIFSVKFLDDVCTAFAYMARHNCDPGVISDYVGMLRYQNSASEPAKRFPSPVSALGLPSNPLNDPSVKKSSGNALKSTVYFLMAHELAHVLYTHRSYDTITPAEAQAQEFQADSFALEIMARIGVPPVALAHFFAIASRFEAAPGDFSTLSGFEAYLREKSTHPLTSERLSRVSACIRDKADQFIRLEPSFSKSRMVQVADDLQQIAQTLEDRAIREYQRIRGRTTTWDQIASTCR